LADYAAKKSKKPGPIAKSSVILDVKPWDDTTDLKEMENLVRSIEQDGLLWGAAKLVPVGYGINKLQIVSTIEDAKVSVDDIIERIQDDFQDHVSPMCVWILNINCNF
jgi:translation elongation factor EF-1beta